MTYVTNKQILDALQEVTDSIIDDMNHFKEWSHKITEALELMQDNMSATMLVAKEARDLALEILDRKKKEDKGLYT